MTNYKNPNGSVVSIYKGRGALIEPGAWIGAGVRIEAGVWIEAGARIGAGAMTNKEK